MFEGNLRSFIIAIHTCGMDCKYDNVSPDNFCLLFNTNYNVSDTSYDRYIVPCIKTKTFISTRFNFRCMRLGIALNRCYNEII